MASISRMKNAVCIALAALSTGCLAQGTFSCNYGQRAACLGYSDKVVDSNAACFNQYACGIGGGFVCKSKLDEVEEEYNTLVRKYNDLLRKHKELAENGANLVNSYRSLEGSLEECNRKLKQTQDDLSESQDQLRAIRMEADDLRNENIRLQSEILLLKQQKRKTNK